jgi:hypothetical protein
MNAYELADLMFDVTDCETSEYYKAGMMLRQQADRILELEAELLAVKMQLKEMGILP